MLSVSREENFHPCKCIIIFGCMSLFRTTWHHRQPFLNVAPSPLNSALLKSIDHFPSIKTHMNTSKNELDIFQLPEFYVILDQCIFYININNIYCINSYVYKNCDLCKIGRGDLKQLRWYTEDP